MIPNPVPWVILARRGAGISLDYSGEMEIIALRMLLGDHKEGQMQKRLGRLCLSSCTSTLWPVHSRVSQKQDMWLWRADGSSFL